MANQKHIYVYLDWLELGGLQKLGILQVEQLRGKEVFSFSHNKEWLESGFAMLLDPDLGLYGGPQYLRDDDAETNGKAQEEDCGHQTHPGSREEKVRLL